MLGNVARQVVAVGEINLFFINFTVRSILSVMFPIPARIVFLYSSSVFAYTNKLKYPKRKK